MEINSDFSELLSAFNRLRVRYLVVGGYAVVKYTEPRYEDLIRSKGLTNRLEDRLDVKRLTKPRPRR